MIQRPLQCDPIFNFFLFPGLLNPLLFFGFLFFLPVFVFSRLPFSLPSHFSFVSLSSEPGFEMHFLIFLLCCAHRDSALHLTPISIFLLISTAACSSFSYLLRDFFLSESVLCGCQGTHLLPQSYSILIVCWLPNTTFDISNALQKLSCIVILLSLVSQQFFFCKFDSF